MAVDPPSTHHSHLDPSDLCLYLTSRSSYSRKYRSAADPTFNPKGKSREHKTRSGSCYRHDPSVEGSTNSYLEQVAKTETPRKSIHIKKTPEYRSYVKTPHDDPLVITIKARNFNIKRVLVDNGSFTEVLFYDAFKKMNIPTDRLRKMDTSLYGFSNHQVTVKGIIALSVAIGTPPTQANLMLDFVLVRAPSAYNAILGLPTLNQLQAGAVLSTYHLKMKFPTEQRIGEVKGDHTTARQCYMTLCKSKNKEVLIIEDRREDMKMQRGAPVKDLVSIEVYPGDEKKTVRIGSNLKEDTKLELVNLLRTYAHVFAWTTTDIPRIDPELMISEALDPWNLYVDGSLVVGSSRAKIILISPKGFVVEYALRFGFQALYIEAEYKALLTGIRLAHALKVDSLSVHSNSQLVVNHILGDYEAMDERMAQYLQLVKTLASNISSQTEIGVVDQEPCWMDMIIRYFSTGELPSERHEARNLRVKAARYALVEGVLYKKSFSLPYLRCLRPSESFYTLQEVHEGICGQHLRGRTLAQKILRQGYYWPTMQKDAIEFTRRPCTSMKQIMKLDSEQILIWSKKLELRPMNDLLS
ncbi:hypothetical protein RJ639_022725 [Escallonia herrerae]|uniref:RNase H type-1 domain-containing protein n=1 Tax=Escallonia herrerae TaxID=1293975 RepID=A0AA88V0L4_9ASTE|nr:hypothetical protein RJ639_022725 [Escallonia herrerae]